MNKLYYIVNTILIIILIGTLFGCGKKELRIAPEFATQFNHFNNIARQNNIIIDNLTIEFGIRDNIKLAGECFSGEMPKIYINQITWNKLTNNQRLVLVMHEMGHCILKLQHNEEVKNNCPVSYMFPSVLTNNCIEQNSLNSLDKKLFQ